MMKRFGAILLAMCMVMQTVTPVFAEELMADVVTEVVTDEQEAAVDSDAAGFDADGEEDAFLEDSNLLINDDALIETATEAEDPFAGLIEDEEPDTEADFLETSMVITDEILGGDAGDPFRKAPGSTGPARARRMLAVSTAGYYGSQLSMGTRAREFYDQLVGWMSGSITKTDDEYTLILTTSNPYTYTTTNYVPGSPYDMGTDSAYTPIAEALQADIWAAFDALVYDYPIESFWTRGYRTRYTGMISGYDNQYEITITNITFTPIERWDGALADGLPLLKQKIDESVSSLTTEVNSQSTTAEKLKVVHDYVCKNTHYTEDDINSELVHTPLGFYTKDVVCEGYAKIFKILVDRLNITECILVSGMGVTASGSEAHMWNLVQLEDGWHLVDTTWDDQERNKVDWTQYAYFLAGSESVGFSNMTVSADHVKDAQMNAPSLADTTYHEWASTGTADGGPEQCSLCGEYKSTGLHAHYAFKAAGDQTLPSAISNFIPEDTTLYSTSDIVSAKQPTETSYHEEAKHLTWTFQGYDKDTATVGTADVHFIGTWEATEDPKYSVTYVFKDSNGANVPAEVANYLPQGSSDYSGVTVAAIEPATKRVYISGTHTTWIFDHYDKTSVTIGNSHVTVTGIWKTVEDPKYALTYTYASGTPGASLPAEVSRVLSPTTQEYFANTTVNLPYPANNYVAFETAEGTFAWVFSGYRNNGTSVGRSYITTGTNTVLTGIWTKVYLQNWNAGTVRKAATCVSAGERVRYSTDSGLEGISKVETIPVNPNNHVHVVNDPAVAATCTSTGLTAGSHCSDCGKVIKARTTTAALGHSYGPWRTTKAATYFATGLETRSCTRCGDTQSRVLAQIPNPMSVRVNKTSFTWTGKAQKPKVKAVTVNGKKLKSKEYKVTYSNNKNVGTGTVTVTGKKQYSSYKAIVTFKINPPKAKISSAKSKKAGTVVLSWKKIGGVAGYEIQYPGGTIRVSGTKYTFAGLTSKKKASFKVRAYAYVDGVMQYGAWSSAKSCKVK